MGAVTGAQWRAFDLGMTLCLFAVPSAALGVFAAVGAWRAFLPHTCGCMVAPWAFGPSLAAAAVAFFLVLMAGIVTLTAITWLAVPSLRSRMMRQEGPEASSGLGILDAVDQ